MSMFRTSLDKARENIESLEKQLEVEKQRRVEAENALKYVEKKQQLEIDNAVNKLREEMQKRLVESDVQREVAVAKLEVYEKLDTKADAAVIKDMVGKLVDALTKVQQTINVVK